MIDKLEIDPLDAGIDKAYAFESKINEMVEAVNRQETAIIALADDHEDGSWQGVRKQIAEILYPNNLINQK